MRASQPPCEVSRAHIYSQFEGEKRDSEEIMDWFTVTWVENGNATELRRLQTHHTSISDYFDCNLEAGVNFKL